MMDNEKAFPTEVTTPGGSQFRAAAPELAGFSRARLARAQSDLEASVARSDIAGASAVILRNGVLALGCCVGSRDLASSAPMCADTIFRIYSLTKPVTSVAAMILLEEGRILLSDPVRTHLPELGGMKVYTGGPEGRIAQQTEMTIADLMTHTAGLTYGHEADHPLDAMWNATRLFRRDEPIANVVARLAELPLKHQPGTVFEYSIAHDILGALIERVSDESFGAFLKSRIFAPLRMDDTAFAVPAEKLHRLATLYVADGAGRLKIEDPASAASRWAEPVVLEAGGQGLVSTVPDYLRFCGMLRGGGALNGTRILSRKSVELLTTNRLSETQRASFWMKGYGYGLGVAVLMNCAENANLGSVGEYTWAGSASTYFWIDPAEDIIALLFMQLEPSSHLTIARRFKALMYQALL